MLFEALFVTGNLATEEFAVEYAVPAKGVVNEPLAATEIEIELEVEELTTVLFETPSVAGNSTEVVERLASVLLLIACIVGKPTEVEDVDTTLEFEGPARVLFVIALVVGDQAGE